MVTDEEYQSRLIYLLQVTEENVKSLIGVLYPLEVVIEFCIGVLALVVGLVVLHSSCMDINGVVRGLYEVNELVVNGLVVNVSTVMLNVYSEVCSFIVVVMEEHILESETGVYLVSAVEV